MNRRGETSPDYPYDNRNALENHDLARPHLYFCHHILPPQRHLLGINAVSINVNDPYRKSRREVGLARRLDSDFLTIRGKDCIDLLHRLSTNDLRGMEKDESRSTIFVNEKGKLLDFATLIPREDHFLLEVSLGNGISLRHWIEKYTITEDVEVGFPDSPLFKHTAFGARISEGLKALGFAHADPNKIHTGSVGGRQISILRDPLFPGIVWNFYALEDMTDLLIKELGAEFLSPHDFEALRIVEAVPRYGKELSADVNPLESGLEKFVSFGKGCYLGQEVIARLETYKKLKRKLVRFTGEDLGAVAEGSEILEGARAIGFVTSLAFSPQHRYWVGLGYCSEGGKSSERFLRDAEGSQHKISIADLASGDAVRSPLA